MNNFNITDSERLILINQYKILAITDKDHKDHYNDLIFYLEHGDINNYQYLISNYTYNNVCETTWLEVHNILSMFEYLIESYNNFSDDEKKDIDINLIQFKGFDNNHDDKHNQIMDILRYKKEKGNIYPNINFNTHTVRPLKRYRAMLENIRKHKLMNITEYSYMYRNDANLSKANIQDVIKMEWS